MSIVIKGIDMPTEGEHIVTLIKSNGKCSYWKQDTEYGICEPMQTVEAIQIPTPHGRIGDLDEMQGKAYERYFNNTISPYGLYEVNRAIENAPTILEAEE